MFLGSQGDLVCRSESSALPRQNQNWCSLTSTTERKMYHTMIAAKAL